MHAGFDPPSGENCSRDCRTGPFPCSCCPAPRECHRWNQRTGLYENSLSLQTSASAVLLCYSCLALPASLVVPALPGGSCLTWLFLLCLPTLLLLPFLSLTTWTRCLNPVPPGFDSWTVRPRLASSIDLTAVWTKNPSWLVSAWAVGLFLPCSCGLALDWVLASFLLNPGS